VLKNSYDSDVFSVSSGNSARSTIRTTVLSFRQDRQPYQPKRNHVNSKSCGLFNR